MAYRIAVALAVVLLAISASAGGPITDKSGSFSVTLAADWTTDRTEDLMDLVGPRGVARVNVSRQPRENVTLADFEKAFVEELRKGMESLTIVSEGRDTIGGVDARVWVYTAVVDGVRLQFKSCVMIKGDHIYSIVLATLPDRYRGDVSGLDAILDSWKWL